MHAATNSNASLHALPVASTPYITYVLLTDPSDICTSMPLPRQKEKRARVNRVICSVAAAAESERTHVSVTEATCCVHTTCIIIFNCDLCLMLLSWRWQQQRQLMQPQHHQCLQRLLQHWPCCWQVPCGCRCNRRSHCLCRGDQPESVHSRCRAAKHTETGRCELR